MASSEPVREIRRLGSVPRIGAIAMAERALDADADLEAADRVAARDLPNRAA